LSEHIEISGEGAVRRIRMNRRDKKNALTSAMYQAMAAAIEGASGDANIRCILLTGVPGAFCAGNDLQDFLAVAKGGEHNPVAQTFLHTLARSQRPLVAAVQGVAIGVGTTMCLHCDYVVAATDAHFATPFVNLGLVPEAASSLLAPRVMGHQRAFAMLAMGEPLSGEQAQQAGFVNRVVAAEAVEAEGMRAAQRIAALPPEAVAMTRSLLRPPVDEVTGRIDKESAMYRERLKSAEARTAFEAFVNRKR
jgi:enoyl-CoA hydratase/carnithine racemase